MSLASQNFSEYLDVRVFLYKYTPQFTLDGDPANPIGTFLEPAKVAQLQVQATQDATALSVYNLITQQVQQVQPIVKAVFDNQTIRAAAFPVVNLGTRQQIVQLIQQYTTVVPPAGDYLLDFRQIVNNPKVEPDPTSATYSLLSQYSGKSEIPKVADQAVFQAVSDNLGLDQVESLFRIPAYPTVSYSYPVQTGPSLNVVYNNISGIGFLNVLQQDFGAVTGPGWERASELHAVFTAWAQHAASILANTGAILRGGQKLQTLQQNATNSRNNLQDTLAKPWKIIRYKIDLDAEAYFSKFDISRYVNSYSFSQDLSAGVPQWALTLQDAIIPFSSLGVGPGSVRVPAKGRIPTGDLVTFDGPPARLAATATSPGLPGTTSPNTVPGPKTSPRTTMDLLQLMAQYETQEDKVDMFQKDANAILQGYLQRGALTSGAASASQQANLSIPNQSSIPGAVLPPTPLNIPQLTSPNSGLRLSDLCQEYNLISVFVYKAPVSFAQAKQALFPNNQVPFQYKGSTPVTEPFNEANEVHLMLAGFKNEFNGFISTKSFERDPGKVDLVHLGGHGILRLLSDTRVLADAALTLTSTYDAAEQATFISPLQGTTDPQQAVSIYSNRFANQTPDQIIEGLLQGIYRMEVQPSGPGVLATPSTSVEDFSLGVPPAPLLSNVTLPNFSSTQTSNSDIPGYYNLAAFVQKQYGIGTKKNQNLFTIPVFLLATVMKLRNFNNLDLDLDLNGETINQTSVQNAGILKNFYSPINPKQLTSTNFSEQFGGPCYQISANSANYKSFFLQLKTGFSNFNSGMMTPFEIWDKVKTTSYLEFFERPNGRIVMRSPQYNSPDRPLALGGIDPTGNLITNSEGNTLKNASGAFISSVMLLKARYSDTSEQLLTRLRGSYQSSLISGSFLLDLIQPGYANGKLMMQYGFREGLAEPNPMLDPARLSFLKQSTAAVATQDVDMLNLFHKYLYFGLQYDNAGLRIGQLDTEGDPDIEVGKLFWDQTNCKIGYIVKVSKHLTVGQTYTASVTLKFVRDASSYDPTSGGFRVLGTLEELNTMATDPTLNVKSRMTQEFPSVPPPQVTPATLAQISTQLVQGLKTNPIGGLATGLGISTG